MNNNEDQIATQDLKKMVNEWMSTKAGQQYLQSQSGQNKPSDTNEQDVNNAKELYKHMNTQPERRDYVRKTISDRQQQYGGDRKYQALMAKIQAQDSTLKSVLKEMKKEQKPYSSVGARAIGNDYNTQQNIYKELHGELVEAVKDKLGVYPSRDLANYLCKKFNVVIGTADQVKQGKAHLTYNEWEELVALDDFGGIVKSVAMPLLQTYGPQAIRYVWNKFFGDRYSSAKDSIVSMLNNANEYSQKSGLPSSIPGNYSENTLQPASSITISGVNQQNPGFESMRTGSNEYSYNAVNVDYIQTFVCPEKYCYRKPTQQPSKIALAQGCVEFNVTTDALGNAFIYILPQNATGIGSSSSTAFAFSSNATSSFVPSTGGYIGANVTSYPGPLNALTNNIEFFRLSAASIQVTPIVSANTSVGNIQQSYFQNPVNSTFTTSFPSIPQGNLTNMPFYQSSNMMTSTRSVHIPDDNDNEVFGQVTQPPFTEGWYVLVTGATPNTQVLKIDVYYVYEFFPQSGSMPICVMDYGKPGSATISFIANLVRIFPAIQSLTPQEVMCFSNKLKAIASNGIIDHDTLLKHMVSYAGSFKKQSFRNYISTVQQPDEEGMNMSEFDI